MGVLRTNLRVCRRRRVSQSRVCVDTSVREMVVRGAMITIPTTATAPASEVEAVVRSPTNMADAEIAAVDLTK